MSNNNFTADDAQVMTERALNKYDPEQDPTYLQVKENIRINIAFGFDDMVFVQMDSWTGLLEQKLINEGFGITDNDNGVIISWYPKKDGYLKKLYGYFKRLF